MIKQIFGKLPRKSSSKLSPNDSSYDEVAVNSSSASYGLSVGGNSHLNSSFSSGSFSNSANMDPSRPATNGTFVPSKSNLVTMLSPQVGSALVNYVAASEALPSLREVPISERPNLFLRKLNMCSVVFEFTDPAVNVSEKDAKRRMLLELVDYISSVNSKFSETAMQEITKMVLANLFRALPSSNHDVLLGGTCDPEDEEPKMDPSWPHLQAVYELLLRFVVSSETDAKLAKRYIDHSFVLRLLELFDSEDQREREYLKTILHRVYGKFMVHRPFIRKSINNIFYHFIFVTEKHNGIGELLEILGSIINGFALPLKEEHKLFLVRALIPLHKPKCMAIYHQQLSYCITQFVEKDFKLADTVIRGLLKYWPITNSSKEVMLLSELEEVLEATQAAEFQRCAVLLFRQMSRCLTSAHFQVAERALFLWNNDHIRNLITQNQKVILPIVLPSLEKNLQAHWNHAVQNITANVRNVFLDADPTHFEECLAKFHEDEMKEIEMLERRESVWRMLENKATSLAMSNEATLISKFPFSVAIATRANSRTAI